MSTQTADFREDFKSVIQREQAYRTAIFFILDGLDNTQLGELSADCALKQGDDHLDSQLADGLNHLSGLIAAVKFSRLNIQSND